MIDPKRLVVYSTYHFYCVPAHRRLLRSLLGRLLVFFFMLCVCTACATMRGSDHCTALPEEPAVLIRLISHGWHTGIIFNVADIPDGSIPNGLDLEAFNFIEVGYGDASYYQGKGIPFLSLITAGLLPTSAVLHVVKFNTLPEEYFSASDIQPVMISVDSLSSAWRYVADTFRLDPEGFVIETGPGLYGNSLFYEAKGRFTAFRNCNVWIGEVLEAARCPVDSRAALTSGAIMRHGENLSEGLAN